MRTAFILIPHSHDAPIKIEIHRTHFFAMSIKTYRGTAINLTRLTSILENKKKVQIYTGCSYLIIHMDFK